MSPRFSLGLLVLIILAVLVGVLAGQSQPPTAAAPPPAASPTPLPPPGPNQVFIEPSGSGGQAVVYVHARTVARVGQKVTWINLDSADHSVTADNGAFSQLLSPHEAFTWIPKSAGTYPYGDFLNPNARGMIVVQP